jgi:hypothetical protein
MILEKHTKRFKDYDSSSFVTDKKLIQLLDKQEDFKTLLKKLYQYDNNKTKVIQIGNADALVKSLAELDSECEKLDVSSFMKDIQLKQMMEDEKAIFEIFNIQDHFILRKNKSDILNVETRYSSKGDLLDYYNFSRFANYCRDLKYDDLVSTIQRYLKDKNIENKDTKSLRLIYKNEDEKFYIRALTSVENYQNFGLNFSAFVALMALSRYVESSKNEIYIDHYVVDDSTLYASFSLSNETPIKKNLTLSFNLILENDEIKRKAVTFNGVFKLKYEKDGEESEVYLRPHGMKTDQVDYPVDLLSYKHSGKVQTVFDKIKDLPNLIEYFIKQVTEDAEKIANIKNYDDVRQHLIHKVRYAKKKEFLKYKGEVLNKLMKITADNTFTLFEVFRNVEELFENQDVASRDYWRTKLYEVMINKK